MVTARVFDRTEITSIGVADPPPPSDGELFGIFDRTFGPILVVPARITWKWYTSTAEVHVTLTVTRVMGQDIRTVWGAMLLWFSVAQSYGTGLGVLLERPVEFEDTARACGLVEVRSDSQFDQSSGLLRIEHDITARFVE